PRRQRPGGGPGQRPGGGLGGQGGGGTAAPGRRVRPHRAAAELRAQRDRPRCRGSGGGDGGGAGGVPDPRGRAPGRDEPVERSPMPYANVAIAPEQRTAAALTHLSGLAGYLVPLCGVLVPLIIWLIKSDSP